MSSATGTKTDTILVIVSDDCLTASIRLRQPDVPVTSDDVCEALRAENIAMDDAVRERIDEFVTLVADKKAPDAPFVIARGKPATAVRHETFVFNEELCGPAREWNEDAPVDFYTFNSIITVEKGQAIGSIVPGTPAADGCDVRGRTIEHERSEDGSDEPKKLRLDKTVARAKNNPTLLVAQAAGQVVENQNVLRIDEILRVEGDVGFETGNIDTTVDVHINGKITELFEVRSARSMAVGAAIEAAKVTAGRNITVRRGIVGRRMGLVMAGMDIVSKHASESHLLAMRDIRIGKQLMNSHACAVRNFTAEAAAVIGGSLYVGEVITVNHLGSVANVPTQIVTGVRADAIRDIALINQRIAVAEDLTERARQLLDPLLAPGVEINEEQRQQAEALIARIEDAKIILEENTRRRTDLLDNIYVEENAHVQVTGQIFAKTRVRVADRETYFHKDVKGPITIEKRKIKNVTELVGVNPLSGSVKVLTSERCTPETLLDGFELEQKSDAAS